jgi:Tfp pilus assembly protein PilO
MKFQLRQRDRRAVLGLVGAAALYLVFSELVFPAFDRIKEAGGRAAEKEEQLMKYRQALQRKGHYTELLQQARKNVAEAESRLIRGDNPSLASIELQTLMEDAAKTVSIEFVQKSFLPAKKKDDYFNEITMAVSFDSTPNQLTTFLANLRNAAKFVTVRNMQLAPTETPTAPPKKGEFKKIVHVNLTVGAILPIPEKKG